MPHPQHINASPAGIALSERSRQALELRKAGYGFTAIAEALGYKDHSGAYRAVRSALKRTLQQPADEVRAIECERLDHLIRVLWPAAIRGDVAAIDRVLRIMERRATLLGLDAPVKREVSGAVEFRHYAERVAGELGLDAGSVLAEAERIVANGASGQAAT